MEVQEVENNLYENKAGKIWEEYSKMKEYQDSMDFRTDFPEIIRFKEGDQWPAPTQKTKNFPRPVFNITEMFIRNKRAAVTNQNMEISYVPLEVDENEEMRATAEQGARAYSEFSKVQWENVDQNTLNNEFVDDAITLGTGLLHYYWDDNITGGGTLKYIGDLAGEIIDVLNFGVANPREKNIQKQEALILESRKTIRQVQELAKKEGITGYMYDLIKPDNYDALYDSDKKVKDDDEVTVLTKYFRKNGEVYYSKSTHNVMLIDDRSLTPTVSDEEAVENEEAIVTAEPAKITLYPVVVLTYKNRKKSFYGIGEAQDIIPINKLYNQLKGMMALNVIRTGNPNILIKKKALTQTLTNEGGQQIIDNYEGGGDRIKYMQPPNFSNEFSKISAEIFDMARTLTGNTDVSTGEVLGANMAASAIIALQNQAKTPIKEFQQKFFSAMKEVGDIWCQFYKTYYSTARNISVENDGEVETETFRGTDYAGTDFKTRVEVTVSSDKESLSMSVLENMKAAGDITKEQYVELAPDSAIPFKAKLKEMWGKTSQEKMLLAQAMEQIKAYRQMLGQGGAQNEVQTMPNGNVY